MTQLRDHSLLTNVARVECGLFVIFSWFSTYSEGFALDFLFLSQLGLIWLHLAWLKGSADITSEF